MHLHWYCDMNDNHGSMNENFIYLLESLSGDWFETTSGIISIESGDNYSISICGDINNSQAYNDIKLTISSENNFNMKS